MTTKEDLKSMHHVLREVCRLNGYKARSEAGKLMDRLSKLLGVWPLTTYVEVETARHDYNEFMRGIELGVDFGTIANGYNGA